MEGKPWTFVVVKEQLCVTLCFVLLEKQKTNKQKIQLASMAGWKKHATVVCFLGPVSVVQIKIFPCCGLLTSLACCKLTDGADALQAS